MRTKKFIYDEYGNRIKAIRYYRRSYSDKLVGDYNNEYSYDEHGTQTMVKRRSWDDNIEDWKISEWYTMEPVYDTERRLLKSIMKKWNPDSTCISGSKLICNYNIDKTSSENIRYNWNPSTNSWNINNRTEATYNTDGKILQSAEYNWDTSNNGWIIMFKEENEYNNNGVQTNHKRYTRDENLNTLVLTKESKRIYNDKENIKQSFQRYRFLTNDSLIGNRSTYYYSGEIATEVFNLPIVNEINIYPNPAENFIAFNIKDKSTPAIAELYDLNGRKVLSQQLLFNKQLSVNHLNSGIYFWRITQGGKTNSGKVIIK